MRDRDGFATEQQRQYMAAAYSLETLQGLIDALETLQGPCPEIDEFCQQVADGVRATALDPSYYEHLGRSIVRVLDGWCEDQANAQA